MPYPGTKELWTMIWFAQTMTVVVYANVPHAITVRIFTIETDEINTFLR